MQNTPDPHQLILIPTEESSKITHIAKRDGRRVSFNKTKIVDAIYRAAVAVGGSDRGLADQVATLVLRQLNRVYPAGTAVYVEEIQDLIEKVLIDQGHAKTAKAFILYRAEHQLLRESRLDRRPLEDIVPYKVLWQVFNWNVDHECHTLAHLNRHLAQGTWGLLIKEAEAAYHAEVRRVADRIALRHPRLVIVAGPSSSGKTTTTLKIAERLAEKGFQFSLLTVDNYFKDLSVQPRDSYGDYDFENPDALDLALINQHLKALLKGETVETPLYNFKKGHREKNTRPFRLDKNHILLIDSLHGLYEPMTESVPRAEKFRFYIEALCQIKDTQGEFVRWADLRMLRRMARDHWHRSYDPLMTVGHWHYVRRSELKHIVPYIPTVDFIFNGALPYELPYHKRRLFRFLEGIMARFQKDPQKNDAFIRARRVYELLKPLEVPPDDSAVPDNSLLREFIGGSRYSY